MCLHSVSKLLRSAQISTFAQHAHSETTCQNSQFLKLTHCDVTPTVNTPSQVLAPPPKANLNSM